MTALIYPVILAAGGSSRLGQAKQLLAYKGRTLLQNTLDVSREVAFAPRAEMKVAAPVVVLGADFEAIASATDLSEMEVLINENWQTGMSSSIKLATRHILSKLQSGTAAGIIFLLSDQPHLSKDILSQLLEVCGGDAQTIVASKFEDSTLGPPVFFGERFFEQLLVLEGDVGARKVIQANHEHVKVIDFALGSIDIDTQEDFKTLRSSGPR
jgi:molybdenum cofactor cytidylyltransferase